QTGHIALIGPNTTEARIMGGGSAQLNPHYAITPQDAMAARLGDTHLSVAQGCTNHRWEPLLKGDFTVAFYNTPDLTGDPVHTEKMDSLIAFWTLGFGGGSLDRNNFSARITGTYVPDCSGLHRAGLHSAGFSRFKVDGVVVADAWTHWARGRTFFEYGCDEVVGDVMLEAGRAHDICIEYARVPIDDLGFSAWRAGLGRPMGDSDITAAAAQAAAADVAVVYVGRSGEWDTEGSDLDTITLPGRQDDLVAAVAAANPKTVVVLQTGGPCEMPWIDDVAAVVQAWYPGQECGNAIADVLFGDVDPGGRLPQSFPRVWADNPTHSDDPRVYPGAYGAVDYREGQMIGYRHYRDKGIAPLFPFGHGLSYTQFDMGSAEVTQDGAGSVVIRVPITNIGPRSGHSVVQAYVTETPGGLPIALRGFAKLTLAAGDTGLADITLPARAFAWCDTDAGCWRVDAGPHRIALGWSVADLPQEVTVTQTARTLPY
ncbi:MAG: glycoside hydrolase family 3 C-terminal domain-containing protein, partial [Primorskyibacter sp.]